MDASELTYAIVLLNNIDCFDDLCILSIAFNSECKSFLADPIVQTTIDCIWLNGLVKNHDSKINAYARLVVSIASLGTLAPFLLFKNKAIIEDMVFQYSFNLISPHLFLSVFFS